MSSNLPPGVTESMIPGNRPEDLRYERVLDALPDDVRDEVDSESPAGTKVNEFISDAVNSSDSLRDGQIVLDAIAYHYDIKNKPSKMEVTPGDWVACDQKGLPGHCTQAQVFAMEGDKLHVANMRPTKDPGEASANARLVAAAPNMVDTLKEAYLCIKEEIDKGSIPKPEKGCPSPCHDVLEDIKKVLAKAGTTPE